MLSWNPTGNALADPAAEPRLAQVAVVACYAPKAGAGRYRRPVSVRVYIPADQAGPYAREGKGRQATFVRYWDNVDSRYDGPRSAYGRALDNACLLSERINRKWESLDRDEILVDIIRS